MLDQRLLVLNIGTRNLVYRKPDGLQEIERRSFRKETKKHAEMSAAELQQALQVVIIPLLLEALEEAQLIPDTIVLFVSDQRACEGLEPEDLEQDTLYAGKIIQALLPLQYPLAQQMDIHIERIPVSVFVPNQLIPEYKKRLHALNKKYDQPYFIICESGGTAQQKASLQLAVEYLLDKKSDRWNKGYQYEFWRVKEMYYQTGPQKGLLRLDEGVPSPVEQEQYRQVIDKQQIELLLQKGNYTAAAQIRRASPGVQQSDYWCQLLACCRLRKQLLLRDAKSGYSQGQKSGILPIDQFLAEVPLGTYNAPILSPIDQQPLGKWSDCLDKNSFIQVCEAFSVAEYYYELEQWTDLVLAMQTFIENCLRDLIYYNVPVAYHFYNKWSHLIAHCYQMRNLNPDKAYDQVLGQQFDLNNKLERSTLVNTVDKKMDVANLLTGSELHWSMIRTFYRCHSGIFKNLQLDNNNISREASDRAKERIKDTIQVWHPYNKWINGLRNKIAHTGEGVASEAVLDAAVVTNYLLEQQPDYQNGLDPFTINSIKDLLQIWRQLLGIQKTNVYLRTNEALIEHLKNH